MSLNTQLSVSTLSMSTFTDCPLAPISSAAAFVFVIFHKDGVKEYIAGASLQCLALLSSSSILWTFELLISTNCAGLLKLIVPLFLFTRFSLFIFLKTQESILGLKYPLVIQISSAYPLF